jgi:hypothetical protein
VSLAELAGDILLLTLFLAAGGTVVVAIPRPDKEA